MKQISRKTMWLCNLGTVICIGACVCFGIGIYHSHENRMANQRFNNEVRTGKVMSPQKAHRLLQESRGTISGYYSTPSSRQMMSSYSKMNNRTADQVRQIIGANLQAHPGSKMQKASKLALRLGNHKPVFHIKNASFIQVNFKDSGSAKQLAKDAEKRISNISKKRDATINYRNVGISVNVAHGHVHVIIGSASAKGDVMD